MKKKLEVIVKYFYPVAAGIETNTLETYAKLVKMGWEVTVHTSKNTLTEQNILKDEDELRGIKIKRYSLISENKGFWPKFDWDKTNLVCLHNFNVFFIRFFIYKLYRKLKGKKSPGLVLTPHGGFNPDWSVFPKIVSIIKPIYHYTLGTLLINLSVDGVRAVSEWEKREMIKKGLNKNKVEVISNGMEDEAYVDVDKFAGAEVKQKVKNLGRYLIQIGRIYAIKNNETTIKALPFIPDDIKFVLVGPIGSEEYKKSLDKLTKSLHLENRVIFWGVIRGVDKYYLIKHAKIMVHMAIWESFCNVVHEAMSQGLPVIAANNTALPLLIRDDINGYLVETKNYKKVAEKINFILDEKNSGKIIEISKACKEFTKDNTWTRTAEKMQNFYNLIIEK
jgi:glycosyltransferase involved in cell wall biosynthesis